jgi:hypothetical protein
MTQALIEDAKDVAKDLTRSAGGGLLRLLAVLGALGAWLQVGAWAAAITLAVLVGALSLWTRAKRDRVAAGLGIVALAAFGVAIVPLLGAVDLAGYAALLLAGLVCAWELVEDALT